MLTQREIHRAARFMQAAGDPKPLGRKSYGPPVEYAYDEIEKPRTVATVRLIVDRGEHRFLPPQD